MTLPQLITIANQFKARFNAHIASELVHVKIDTANRITAPDAFDATYIYTLVNEEQTKYINHLHQPGVHLYDDITNIIYFRDTHQSFGYFDSAVGVFYGYAPNPPNIGLKLSYNII
jgi:heptaprenylglyceryl phosphate synthase